MLLAASLPAMACWAQDRSPVPAGIESRVIAWRRDIHQNPERGNREFRTSKLVARMLPSLRKVVGTENVMLAQKSLAAEDYSFYAETVGGN